MEVTHVRRRTIGITVAAVIATVAIAGYGAASAVVYDTLTKVSGDCPVAWERNDPTNFELLAHDGGPVDDHEDFDTSPYLMPEPEVVTIPSRDAGIEISGWYVPAASPDAPTVIVVHGLTACKRDHAVLLPAGMLHRNGFAVLLIDLRDHGDSTFEDGRYAAGTEEYRDVLGAWDWLQSAKGAPADRIGLVGISLGAATTLIATGHEPGVAATWEDSSYADLPSIIRDELTRSGYPTFLDVGATTAARLLSGDDLTSYSPLDGVAALDGRPIFITHGDDDERIAVRYGHELAAAAEAAGSHPETWFVPGSGHTEAMLDHPDEYERRLVDFFRHTIGGGS
jgi:dipeptidyl aminopeptidase/acylaminoacyl peptidase